MVRDYQDFVNEVQTRANIVRVASEYTKIKKQGKNYIGLCPFHKEKTPSFHVSPDKNLYYCFGCGAGGNIFQLVMDIEKIDFKEAVRLIAERNGIPIPSFKFSSEKSENLNEFQNINETAASWFFQNLIGNIEALSYLTSRGIKEETIRKYRLGYAPDQWEGLVNKFKKNNFTDELLRKSGLFSIGRDNKLLDLFRGRIIFPIYDRNEKLIAFGGRTLGNDNIKYLNTPETPLFKKSRTLFGLDKALNSIKEKGYAILVEGYFDQIMLWQEGIKNTVAPLGTAFNEQGASILRRYTDKVRIAFDMDDAGRSAAIRALKPLLTIGMDVRIIELPSGKDPDEFVREKGRTQFEEVERNSKNFFDYIYDYYMDGIDTTDIREKVKSADNIIEVVSVIQDIKERELYFRQLADRLNISYNTLVAKSTRSPNTKYNLINRKNSQRDIVKIPMDEKKLIMILLNGNVFYEKEISELIEKKAVLPFTEKIITILLKREKEEITTVINGLINEGLKEEQERSFLSRIMMEDLVYRGKPEKELLDCLNSIEKRFFIKQRENEKKLLKKAEKDGLDEEISKILKKIHDLACQIEKLS
jgi:DNA primase